MGRRSSRIVTLVVAAIAALALFAAPQLAGADTYLGGGTVVFKQQGQAPDADRGVTICDPALGTGIGGGCIPFNSDGSPGAISVSDLGRAVAGGDPTSVAFQVCIDNNGDSKCTSGGDAAGKNCADYVAFSHNDAGQFFNPLGPLPSSKAPGCETTGGWNGYVVFLCEGVHVGGRGSQGVPAHSHPATTGLISSEDASTATGFGDFCGGTRELVVEKDYQVIVAP